MKLINFVYRTLSSSDEVKGILIALEKTGVIDRWAFCFHDCASGAVVPHYHVYVRQIKPDTVKLLLDSIEGGNLIGTVHKEKDIILYMMRHGKCDTANIVANFDVEKVINT